MAKVISQFFADLGYPLRNLRWSWGARRENAILLRTWTDEFAFKERRLRVLHTADAETRPDSFGLDERMVHLKSLWEGGIAGYTVIATAKDKDAPTREIASYRDDVVFPILRLEQNENQDIIAIVGPPVAVAALPKHALTHRTAPGAGDFPLDDSQRSGLSTDSYKDKLPAIRAWLIEVCHVRGTVTYSDVMDRFALTFYPLRNAMSRLGHDCMEAGEPVITALIVDKDTRRCSPGIFEEFHIDDDVLERERCYAHWALQPAATDTPAVEPSMADAPLPDTPPGVAPGTPGDDFEQRMARFTQVQTRPEQPAFRAAVFRACGGRCVISGCAVPEALEAAHLIGRDWRQGHNSASDGILLRRDLHTLYDRGLLRLSEAGQVELSEDVQADYGEFAGIAVAYPSARPAPG